MWIVSLFFHVILQERGSNGGLFTDRRSSLFTHYPQNIYAWPGKPAVKHKVPKRLRLIYFVANFRLFQRGFILLMSACVSITIYNAFLVMDQKLSPGNPSSLESHIKSVNFSSPSSHANSHRTSDQPYSSTPSTSYEDQLTLLELLKNSASTFTTSSPSGKSFKANGSKSSSRKVTAKSSQYERIMFKVFPNKPHSYHGSQQHPITPLPNHHWSNIFSLYNISLVGRYISILPPILLSIPVQPPVALQVRNMPADASLENLKKFVPIHRLATGEYATSDPDL